MDAKPVDYYTLFIIASDPEHAKKYDLSQDERDFVEFVMKLRQDKPE